MDDKTRILKELDAAIDAMDETKINQGLDALQQLDPIPMYVEAPEVFVAHILECNRRENKVMKPKKYFRVAVAAAAIALMGITAYAATTYNLFGFGQGDRYVTVRSNDGITEQEARDMAEADNSTDISEDMTMQADSKDYEFDSVAAAEAGMDMIIPVPAAMPEMKLDSVDGTITKFGDSAESRTLWINYTDEQERLFGLTVVRDILAEGNTVYTESDMDPGSLGSYQSKSGVEYTTLTESDPSGEKTAHIATTMIGEYQYTLVFFGFDETERAEIIDSADLSVYQ